MCGRSRDWHWLKTLLAALDAERAEGARLTKEREKLAKVEALCEAWGIDYDNPAMRLQAWADQQQETTHGLLEENTGLREQLAEAQQEIAALKSPAVSPSEKDRTFTSEQVEQAAMDEAIGASIGEGDQQVANMLSVYATLLTQTCETCQFAGPALPSMNAWNRNGHDYRECTLMGDYGVVGVHHPFQYVPLVTAQGQPFGCHGWKTKV